MKAWNGEDDKYITHDKDTWVADAKKPKPEKNYIAELDIPSEDWVEGFKTATMACAEVVEVRCYPTLMGEVLRKMARDVEEEWNRRQSE